jgi:thiol-disulfide isomerase/thioredoxin
VANARVSFAEYGIWRGIYWETVTDGNGRFQWNDAPAEVFQLQIEKDGFLVQHETVDAGDGKALAIRLRHALHITGKVLDAQSKEPVKEFHIDVMGRNEPLYFAQGYPFSTIPGSNGAYSLDLGRLYINNWMDGYAHTCILRVEADGYASFISRAFDSRNGDLGEVSYDIELQRASQVFGTVVDAGGHPVPGAQVALYTPSCGLFLSGKPRFEGPSSSYGVSDAQGRFHLNALPEATSLVAVQEAGFARITTNEFSSNITVKLQPWGRIEGSLWNYDEVVTNESILATPFRDDSTAWTRSTKFSTTTDGHGRFSMSFVPPGQFAVFGSGMRVTAPVKPGEPAVVKIGGGGRPLVGKFKVANPYVEIEWGRNLDMYYFGTAEPSRPTYNFNFSTAEAFLAWTRQPEIEQAFNFSHLYKLRCAKDGSFRIEQVLPGEYKMMVSIYDPREPDAMAFSHYIAQYEGTFKVPSNNPNTRQPLDLGVIEITLKPDVKSGQTDAPEFDATDMTGKKFSLADYRGKYVLLDFWATWCGPCVAEIPYLKKVHDKFKERSDFAMISLSLDKTIAEPREFLKKNDLPWVQGYLGNWSDAKVAGQYGVQGIPAVFLVSPDGKIIESELEGSAILPTLEKRLK